MILLASNGSAVLLPAWMLNFAIAVFVQSTIVIAAGLILAAWLRRRDVATASILLRGTVIAGMLCPLILCLTRRSEAFAMHVRLPLQEQTGRLLGLLIVLAWVAIALAMLTRIVSAVRSLRRLRRESRSASYQWIEDAGRCARAIGMMTPSVLQTEHVVSPCLTGYKRPTILLPAGRSETRHDILLHEMAHVRRHDCLWHLLAYVATAVLWFQPLMWVLTRRLITTADEACDDFVLAFGSSRSDYARVLIDLAEQHKGSWQGRRLAVGLVHWKSTLSRRVVNIMDTSRDVVIDVRHFTAMSGIIFLAAVTALASLVATSLSIAADPAPPAPARLPVPEAAVQLKTEKVVRDVFGNYAASPLAGRPAIAAKMLEQGIATADDPAARYVLLKDAGELSAAASDAATAMRAASTLASFYAVDESELKLSLLRRCTIAATTPNIASAVATEGLNCANDAVNAENYDQANRFMQPTEQMARASKDVTLILSVQARAADIRWLQQESARAKTAQDKLTKTPADPEANHALGRYFCLVRGDWKRGLIGLSKGSNAPWQTAATADLANPTASDKQVAAGDKWWDLADKETAAVAQRALRRRAGYWYSQAAANPQFAGLKRSLVEKRLAQIPPPGPGEAVAEVPSQQGVPEPISPPAVNTPEGVFTNSIGMKLVLIPAGEFNMGSPPTEFGRGGNETLHHVKIARSFLMATTTVTQAQWTGVMGNNPSNLKGNDRPVEQISWNEAVAFCAKLSAKEGGHYRLPTEAEWEYACRAGTQTPYGFGDGNLDDFAWSTGNSEKQTHNVATKKPNRWGIYDMQGNVLQLCSDAYGPYAGDAVDPKGGNDISTRIARGGSWANNQSECRAACRHRVPPDERHGHIGFRVCLDTTQSPGVAVTPASQVPAVASGNGTWIDLLRLIDPWKDAKVGNWKLENGVLSSDETNGARVQIPYLPPEEYDYRIVFARNAGTSAVVQFASRQGHEMIWDIGRGGPKTKFMLNEKRIEQFFEMENGHKYTSLIKVRRGSVQFFLDDHLILEEKDDARLYDPGTWYALSDKRCLGIGSHFSPTSFYSVEVREVTGHGSMMRPATGNISNTSPNAVTNSLGMKLVLIPAGEFMMGSPPTEEGRKSEETLHHVRITKPFLMATTAVTQAEWSAVMGSNPSKFQGDNRPVEKVSWNDAVAFCEKLGAKEGKHYRLPTEAEWEYACRAGTQTAYGGANNLNEMGWYKDNSDAQTHPVAQKKANAWGLYDMQGNVNQWCSDGYGGPYGGDAIDPQGANGAKTRVVRGGAWKWNGDQLRAAWRGRAAPGGRHDDVGFRLCLDATQPLGGAATPGPAYTPPSGGNIFTDTSPNAVTNSIGMKLVLIPAGEFNMGSPETEVGRENNEKLHRVKITKPYLIAATLVTQANWKAIMGKNPSGTKGDDLPVDEVTWHDAVAFCEKLSATEGKHYRLPTEAEWEYAARAGTQTPFSFGDGNIDDFAWYQANSQAQIHKVATKKPNQWGLFDMQGNVWQWCSDWYGPYAGDAVDPKGVEEGRFRVTRGASYQDTPARCRAACRHQFPPAERGGHIGFRVCLDAPQAAGVAMPVPTKVPPGGNIFTDGPAPTAPKGAQAFATQRNALPAGRQIAATIAKLNEVNGGGDVKASIRPDTDGTFRVDITNQDSLVTVEPLYGLHVSKLNLDSCRNLKSLDGVQGMPLTELNLTNCFALEGDLSLLKGMRLTKLSLRDCKSLKSLNGIQRMPLTELNLYNCFELEGDLAALRGMQLTQIHIGNCKHLASLNGIQGMPLTELDLTNCFALEGDLSALKGMQLKHLSLFGCPRLESLSGIEGMPLTGELNIGHGHELQGDLSALKGMKLTKLDLYECFKLKSLNGLQAMPLTELNLTDCHALEDLLPLKGMPLTKLNLYQCQSLKSLDGLEGAPIKELVLTRPLTKAYRNTLLQMFPTLKYLQTGDQKLDEELSAELKARK